jgi:hypothetical protein
MLIYPGSNHAMKIFGGRKIVARLQTRGHQFEDDIFINAVKDLIHVFPS